MISVIEAKNIIRKNVPSLDKIEITIDKALGYVLADDIISPINLPSFNQAAMDGYGFIYDDFINNQPIKLIAEIPAGFDYNNKLLNGFGVRIFTGARVPEGIDTIVVQENSKTENNILFFENKNIKKGDNIRLIGQQIKKGEKALLCGTHLNPPILGFLASMGVNKINVYRKPKVGVIITGSELINDESHSQSKIFDANSVTIRSALLSLGISDISLTKIDDNKDKLFNYLNEYINNCDLVILSGGISVGKYDLVYDALIRSQVDELFYKIKQKPGKPLFFGKKHNTCVFALPGNPAAVVACFYNYVFECIKLLCGDYNYFVKQIRLSSNSNYRKKSGLTHFLKSKIENDNTVTILEGQESFVLKTFAESDSMILVDEGQETINSGDEVTVLLTSIQN